MRVTKGSKISASSDSVIQPTNSQDVYTTCRDYLRATISQLATIAENNEIVKDLIVDTSVVLLELDQIK